MFKGNYFKGIFNHYCELNYLGRQAVLGIIRDKLVPAIKIINSNIKEKGQVFNDGKDKKWDREQITEEDITKINKKM